MHSKILDFCELKSLHTGEHIANKVFDCLKEWGLENKVFTITLDNATNNNSMQEILKGQLQIIRSSGLLCDGKFMHVRCCAHILNIIVKKGLEFAKEAFEACVERVD